MNIDDPRLTAYALEDCDHLEVGVRAEIEKALAADPKLASEVEDLRKLTNNLRAELRAEQGEGLTPAQRVEVLTSANAVDPAKVVVSARHRWWRSQVIGLSVAACAVIGLSAAVYYQAEHVRHLEVERDRLLAQTASNAEAGGVPIQLDLSASDLDSPGLPAPAEKLPESLGVDTAAGGSTTWAAQTATIHPTDGTTNLYGTMPYRRGAGILSPVGPAAGVSDPSQQSASFGNQNAEVGAEYDYLKAGSGAAKAATPSLATAQPAGERGRNSNLSASASVEPVRTRVLPNPAKPNSPGGASGREISTLSEGVFFDNSGIAPTTAPRALALVPSKSVSRGFGGETLGDSLATAAESAVPELKRELAEAEEVLKERTDIVLAKRPNLKQTEELFTKLDGAETKPEAETEVQLLGRRVEELRQRIQSQQDGESNTESYDSIKDNPFLAVLDNPLSTFSVDVDTGSYTNVRRFLNANQRPPKGAVRIEELVNYFRYDYPQPKEKDPFGATLEVATCPWEPEHRLVRVGIKGREIPRSERPAANLVFLVDVSGSMKPENKLPLVKESLRLLTDQLGADDSVSIAVYAGASGCVLEPTHDKERVRTALAQLESGGSTNGAAGIQLAYDLAQRAFKKGGANRVILCTDGDFNVGTTDQSQLVSMIEGKAKTGIFLSVLGFGYGNLKDSTLEKLADKGNGFYGYIDTISEGRRLFVEQLAGTLCTIAKDVKIQIEFNPAHVGSYRLIGYENRLLAKEDFNDDTKDAGEIGAGHTVTALYEVVPSGKVAAGLAKVDELKYQPQLEERIGGKNAKAGNGELLTVKVRYKQPDGDTSTKIEFPLTDSGTTWEKSTRDFRWAAAVAGFGMMLRESPHKGSLSWSLVEELAAEGRTEDGNAERAEFVQLVEKARGLSR
jgi:Ca-activated chloride channel family protein